MRRDHLSNCTVDYGVESHALCLLGLACASCDSFIVTGKAGITRPGIAPEQVTHGRECGGRKERRNIGETLKQLLACVQCLREYRVSSDGRSA